jgi:uncharacterized membrane protein YbhN (UPF0104 family)
VIRVVVSAGLGAYILAAEVTAGDIHAAVRGVRLDLVAAAILIYLAGQGLSAVKWWMLGRSVGFEQPLGSYVRFYLIGMFFNVFGPSTVGGDLVRGLYLGSGRRAGLALGSVMFDRLSGLAVLMALGSVALLVSPQYQFPGPVTVTLVAGGVALLAGWWTLPRLVALLPPHHRIRRHVEHDLAPFWRDRPLLLRVVLVSLSFHLSQAVLQYVLTRAAGVGVPFGYCLVFHPVLSVLTALPISVGGIGVREGGYLYFLGRVGVDEPAAIAVGLLLWLVTLTGGALGGIVFLASGAKLPRLRARAAAAGPPPPRPGGASPARGEAVATPRRPPAG